MDQWKIHQVVDLPSSHFARLWDKSGDLASDQLFPSWYSFQYPLFYRSSKPIDVDICKSLFCKIDASFTFGPLPASVSPDEGRVLAWCVGKRVVSTYAGILTLEPTDPEGQITGGNFIGFPLLDDLNFKIFRSCIIIFPKSNRGLW